MFIIESERNSTTGVRFYTIYEIMITDLLLYII